MKNVIYINCWTDPWVRVAQKLMDDGYCPVWWIGSISDKSCHLITEKFPGIVFQDIGDAWKGRFPQEVQKKAAECYLDVDFLKEHAHHELQAIKMMDRMDDGLRSFNFMERQRHFRNMLKQWMAVIEICKPDLIISTGIPHQLFDYVLYWLSQDRGIPFLSIHHTQFQGRFYFSLNGFFTIRNKFVEDWRMFEEKSDVEKYIPNDVLTRFEKVKLDYEQGAPISMKTYGSVEKKMSQPFFMIKRWLRKFTTVYRPYLFGRPADVTAIGHSAYCKISDKKYEDSDVNIYHHERMILKANKYKKYLKKHYDSLVTSPNYNEKYVIYFLHYQPEATTCPGGDIFVDQRLCTELLLKYLPEDYKIYVKEHPHQFLRSKIGHTGRMIDLYDDLVKNERVRLIATEINSFELMKYSKAVCTCTGTVGWEAMVRQKPVIAFGLSWYENYTKGVLRIIDEASAKKMLQFIDEYQYDEHSLLAYLAAVGKNTDIAYYFKNLLKDKLLLSENDCVDNILHGIFRVYSGEKM